MKYEVGKTYDWTGGQQPLPDEAGVKVWFRDGDTGFSAADLIIWEHSNESEDIVRFKVLELPEVPTVRYSSFNPRMVMWSESAEEVRLQWPGEVIAEAQFDSAGKYIPGTLKDVRS